MKQEPALEAGFTALSNYTAKHITRNILDQNGSYLKSIQLSAGGQQMNSKGKCT